MKNLHEFTGYTRPMLTAMAIAGLVGALSLGVTGCDSANSKTPDAAAVPAGAPVSAAAVVEKSIVETQEFSGRLEAIDHVDIRARVSGFITAINFKPGSEVKKGDVLFVIDPRPYDAELERTAGAAGAARAKADLARLELTRSEKLLAERAIAQREYDANAASLKELDADARAAQASYEAAKLNVGYTQVHSPIDGRVSKAEITLGNLIDGTAILTSVVSTDRIYASFDGDEDTYLRVGAASHNGQPVTVKIGLANETGFPHEGKLEFVDNQLDPQTGSVRMRATFANTDHALVPGLFARVQVDGGNGQKDETKALLITERAVSTDQDRKFVWVVGADSKAEYRAVTLGASTDGLRVVRSGLKVGEKIVVSGLQRVRPGAPLAPEMVAMDFDPSIAVPTPADKKTTVAAAKATTAKE